LGSDTIQINKEITKKKVSKPFMFLLGCDFRTASERRNKSVMWKRKHNQKKYARGLRIYRAYKEKILEN
jgi:hypothetical protein